MRGGRTQPGRGADGGVGDTATVGSRGHAEEAEAARSAWQSRGGRSPPKHAMSSVTRAMEVRVMEARSVICA